MTDLRLDHIECADVMDYLRSLPDACVNLVVTSPPYLGLRSYLPDGHPDKAREIGAEQTPAAYIARMVAVFAEVWRVLRDDGSIFCNLGDSYGPNKQLQLIPHRFAIAMQDAGWICRQDICWSKGNPMPESVRDRCTRSHEYIFHFTKQPRYWYDAQAVSEEAIGGGGGDFIADHETVQPEHGGVSRTGKWARNGNGRVAVQTRNRRSVWVINPANFRNAHFATFPEDIPEICIKAACPEWCCEKCGAPYEAQVEDPYAGQKGSFDTGSGNEPQGVNGLRDQNGRLHWGDNHPNKSAKWWNTREVTGYAPSCTCNAGKRAGVVLDPFSGAGTVGLVAKRLNRRYIGCDLNESYVEMARRRIDSIPYTLFSLMEATGD